jgi:D-alanine-D-alanine ligase
MSAVLSHSMTIAVLRGGWSAERTVSLTSGAAVLTVLRDAGYRVRDVVVEKDLPRLLADLTPAPDVIFNALHGRGGEDGTIQGVLEMLDIPYTHSGIVASAVAMDKGLTKTLLAEQGIPCAAGIVVHRRNLKENTLPLALPFVLKPVAEGSSVGIFMIHHPEDWKKALQQMPADHSWWMAETYIPGRELTVPVLDDKALPVIEICPKGGWYDYASKYQDDVHADFLLPAPVPAEITRQVQEWSLLAHHTLRCRAISRSDWRYDPQAPAGRQLYFLEINTQPGMTSLSLTPASAAQAGISFLQLVEYCLTAALEGKNR